MEKHDFFIGAVILIILLVQFIVFVSAINKIKVYKNIIPVNLNFKIIKILIPESQVKDLNVNEILATEDLEEDEEEFFDDVKSFEEDEYTLVDQNSDMDEIMDNEVDEIK